MESENANQKLRDYITTAVKNGISQESIISTLLAKGWLVSEIKNELIVSGSVIDSDFVITDAKKRKARFAIVSPVLFVFALALFFIGQGILSILLSFSGLVLGVIGVRSKKKGYAVSGIILNFLALVFVVFTIGLVVYMTETGKFPFSDNPLSEQDKIDFGISEISNGE